MNALTKRFGPAALAGVAAFASILTAAADKQDGITARVAGEEFSVTFGEVLLWLAMGAMVGSLVGMVSTLRLRGLGPGLNLAVGLGGALLGGIIIDATGLDVGLGTLEIQYEELLAAFAGAGLFVAVGWYVSRRWGRGALQPDRPGTPGGQTTS